MSTKQLWILFITTALTLLKRAMKAKLGLWGPIKLALILFYCQAKEISTLRSFQALLKVCTLAQSSVHSLFILLLPGISLLTLTLLPTPQTKQAKQTNKQNPIKTTKVLSMDVWYLVLYKIVGIWEAIECKVTHPLKCNLVLQNAASEPLQNALKGSFDAHSGSCQNYFLDGFYVCKYLRVPVGKRTHNIYDRYDRECCVFYIKETKCRFPGLENQFKLEIRVSEPWNTESKSWGKIWHSARGGRKDGLEIPTGEWCGWWRGVCTGLPANMTAMCWTRLAAKGLIFFRLCEFKIDWKKGSY